VQPKKSKKENEVMKKALTLLLLAGLAFLPLASFADVVDESLGQGAGFEAALNTGSSDLVQIFPQKAEDFASAVFYRYGYPGDYGPGNMQSMYNGSQFPISGGDNWMGIIDNKLGIGTLAIYTNVPVNFFTNNAGGHPDLSIDSMWGGSNWGGTTNEWTEVVNQWQDWNGTGYGPVPQGSTDADGPLTWPNQWFATPQNKVMVVYADQGFGLSLNYGDAQGNGWSDKNNNTYTDGDNNDVNAGTVLGYKKYSNGTMEFGGAIGYGTKDAGVFSTLDVAGSFELGMIDDTRTYIEENAANNGTNVFWNRSLKDGNGGIYDARLNLLATKDSDEMTQVRLSASGVMSKLGTEELYQSDNDNDGDFTSVNDNNGKRDTSYDNLNILVNAGVVHKIEAGNGKVVASLGVNYRDQSFKDEEKWYNPTASRWEYSYYSNADYSWLMVPVRVGVEQALTGWLTLRLGASTNAFQMFWAKNMPKSDLKADGSGYDDSETMNSSSDSFQNVTFNTGLGVALGNFTFDMLLDQGFLEDNMLRGIRPGAGVLVDGDLVQLYKFQATFKY
jgi:hypothetical protein